MINNYAKNVYHAIRALEVKSQEEKSKGGGLLAPVKNFMKKKELKEDMPSMIVKRSFDLLSNTRKELNGED
jgi:hypothetical protein|tara:strand:+ start:169 stop:381 length:213 start_codon:yes stop_codon:yes gene_type:complete